MTAWAIVYPKTRLYEKWFKDLPNEFLININMPFDPNSAKKAGKKSKRGPAKKEEPSINDKDGTAL